MGGPMNQAPGAPQGAAPGFLPPGRILREVASETLALGCLYERRGDAYIRVPVQRRQQVPGCEWHGRRDGGALRAVTFTFETLDEWVFLAREGAGRIAALYRALLGRPAVRAEELVWQADVYARTPGGYDLAFAAGSYNPFNPWNTARGAVHLTAGAMPGFEASPRAAAAPGPLCLPADGLGAGLLFRDGRDVTAAVLQVTRRGPAGMARRLEAVVPEGVAWSLEDLDLPDGSSFTPLAFFVALLSGGARGGEEPSWPRPAADAMPTLPGPMLMEALLGRLALRGRAPAFA